ncbi:hypothetical protein CRI94_08110 [Longibacter salinarum]|uniref:Microcin J25-processing protein McjB C-terminal domain-containing protein n=1 Tax=Longibacter salinarum TaxID=1850348 RepID=A0A2A8CZF0_9BACT|nr:lasso peptide biosynthesis B2 protein [Longibacter salinarum]PEN14004.1 hypothetical protein CRI94_08110 [Longibacter salinarum]
MTRLISTSRLRRLVSRFRRRSWAERMALAEAFVVVPAAWAALRLVSFRRLLRTTRPPDGHVQWTAQHQRVCWAVQAVAKRWFPSRPCLVQALAALWLLRPRGVRPDLFLGVVREDGLFRAHAWLEVDGDVVLGGRRSPDVFQPFPPLVHSPYV